MKQSKQSEKEESTFLSLCSPQDYDLLTETAMMKLQDFERITYLTMALDFIEYTIVLYERYMDFTTKLSEKLDRENEILKEYPTYYIDEHAEEKCQQWIDDFCNHIPANKQKYYRKKLELNTKCNY